MIMLNYLLSLLPSLLRWPTDDDPDSEDKREPCPEFEGKPHVLLLRSPAEDGYCGTDKYEDAFRARGYPAANVPVLETVYTNIDRLRDVLRKGSAEYAGVVVTSGRACGAWRLAALQLAEGAHTDEQGVGWSDTPFYVVGQSTASALHAIHYSPHASPYCPRDIRGSTESGTGDKLAHFIVGDLSSAPPPASKKLLYLTGDKTKGTLPAIATAAGFDVESLQVYATQGSTRFEDDLSDFLDGVQSQGPQASKRWWIVHFAPSAAKHVSPVLQKYFDIPMQHGGVVSDVGTGNRRARLAVIGPTTASALKTELKLSVDVVAAKPNPEALAEGIAKFDESHV
ncbi:tetrapyrrole biosynthesis uroporphyrinogen III synthase [Ganoderma leucocontextum]|nr:tetrapyrrole biosynthesis uroporphyrinogen III synthase [Ganoderma leucocontextum]